MNYKEKKDQLKKTKQKIGIEIDQSEVVDKLSALETKLVDLQMAVEKGTQHLDTASTNELLEKMLDELVEAQKLSEGQNNEKIKALVDEIANIRVNVNVPKQEQKIVNKILVQDWRKEYIFSDSDKSESTSYVGFVNPSGGWYIERVTKSKTSDKARFVFGQGDYVANWGSRLQLDYKYLFEAFNG